MADPKRPLIFSSKPMTAGFSLLSPGKTGGCDHQAGCDGHAHDGGHNHVPAPNPGDAEHSSGCDGHTHGEHASSHNHAAHDHSSHNHASHAHSSHNHASHKDDAQQHCDGHAHGSHNHASHKDDAQQHCDGHAHGSHNHASHDHSSHNHSHASGHHHGHAHEERAVTELKGEDGTPALQLDLEAILPEETDEKGRFEELARTYGRLPGVLKTHMRQDAGFRQICVHYDTAVTTSVALLPILRQNGARVAKRYQTHTWMVQGMDSPACGEVIEHVLRRTKGVLTADVAYGSERLVVEYDAETIKLSAIEEKMKAVGYPLVEPPSGHACSHEGHACGLAPRHGLRLVGISGALLLVGGLLSFVSTIPVLIPTLCFAGSLVVAGWYPTRSALTAVRQGRVDIETLMILAAAGAGLTGAWFEGAFLLFLFSLGHALEHRAMESARQAVEALARLRPTTAWLRRNGEIVEVPVATVKPGDRMVVRPGDRVALDGVVIEGASHVDQSAITGESVPVARSAGQSVLAGTINVEGSLDVKVTRAGNETTLAKMVDLVAAAEARKSPAQRFTANVEKIFVPIVLIATPLVVLSFLFAGYSFHDAFLRGLGLLVAASPCALAISTPAAVLSAVARAAKGGVLIKGGGHLDSLGTVESIAFDKTGTLTRGTPRLVATTVLQGTEAELLAVAASAEFLSSHPLAKTVVFEARQRNLTLIPASGLEAIHGKGLRAKVGAEQVSIGSLELFGEVPPQVREVVERHQQSGQTVLVVQRDGRFAGVLGVADSLREEAKAAVASLKSLGVKRTILLSGDHRVVAEAVGREVGIDEVRAPLLPEEKVKSMQVFAGGGGVAMVGDGVNDAPALAAASVGVSLGGAGSDVALETADVVLMGDDLSRLPFAVGLARAARRAVYQNITIAIGVSVVLILATVTGQVQIAHAVVLHEGSTLLVVANGLRLLRWREG